MTIRDEVRASAAAHQDLGPGYDTAVAEGLVERIGEEIDRRVDARLFGHLQAPAPQRPRRAPVPGRIGAGSVVLALGSMGLAIGGTAAVLHPGDSPPGTVTAGQFLLVALIWIIIGLVNVAYARRNQLFAWHLRGPVDGGPSRSIWCRSDLTRPVSHAGTRLRSPVPPSGNYCG
ncbi:MAG TPA: hypothetical protein VMU95_23015 [Trebonia sp.]|jgi:hypothetical protein|nr:hypothetical protein [Trebonia sp.]